MLEDIALYSDKYFISHNLLLSDIYIVFQIYSLINDDLRKQLYIALM